MKQKLFVLIKDQMPLEYQGVQGGHAAVQWIVNNGT
jgi:enterochelin esterase-like enzyme